MYAIDSIVNYLRDHKFKPHIFGKYPGYGINNIGSHSTIMFKNQKDVIWHFIWYPSCNTTDACFINAEGKIITIPVPNMNDDNIVRMQVVPPEQLDHKLSKYLRKVWQETRIYY